MKKIFIYLFLSLCTFFYFVSSYYGEPIPGAEIYVELEPDDEPIANTTDDNDIFFSSIITPSDLTTSGALNNISPITFGSKTGKNPLIVAGNPNLDWLKNANFLTTKAILSSPNSPSDFRLKETITRKEVMKIIAKLAGANVVEKCEGKFSDVANDWGCKYIEWALSAGFVSANKTFRPNENITIAEALKLIFKARGITKTVNTKNWQSDYYRSAIILGLVKLENDTLTYGTIKKPKISGHDLVTIPLNSNALRGWVFLTSANTYTDFIQPKGEIISDEAKIK